MSTLHAFVIAAAAVAVLLAVVVPATILVIAQTTGQPPREIALAVAEPFRLLAFATAHPHLSRDYNRAGIWGAANQRAARRNGWDGPALASLAADRAWERRTTFPHLPWLELPRIAGAMTVDAQRAWTPLLRSVPTLDEADATYLQAWYDAAGPLAPRAAAAKLTLAEAAAARRDGTLTAEALDTLLALRTGAPVTPRP